MEIIANDCRDLILGVYWITFKIIYFYAYLLMFNYSEFTRTHFS